ncbi:alkaline D-peptidase. Serine peptidase. MEROPS family S12 [Streptomyces zhaozhouensis]|uniref:Alkaline D-peptidase. Serine peptidase. MEROPS family S12 n=1 Tax=Streptomyces zhaozhouensis TaxID=1300267 RepID=A0A286E8E1_9ACTN|nr:serine hydrolase domain-containing protein [Streptomyces zhaozhouensis]SOD67149.1 alkaline D-peptidase. Serine peptidase. MEROPS family S12 [Streptomyces zhaozhouensis]
MGTRSGGRLRLTAVAAVVCGATAVGAGACGTGEGDRLRSDAEAIVATGVTGVQARVTGPDGASESVAAGVSDTGDDRPVAPDGHFRIGSVNKTLVAAVLLQLAAEERLSLDDTVDSWLPGLVRGNGHDGRLMTVRQLLQHTAGVHDGAYPVRGGSAERYRENHDEPYTPEEVVAAAMGGAPDFAPGEGWSYSNTGYVLLGMVVERATGRPWQDEVEARILGPLGMRDTVWPGDDPGLPEPHAHGYTRFAPGEELVDTTALVDADASGGYVSTTADLDRFARALFDGTLLDEAGRAELTETVPVGEDDTPWEGAGYGLGIFSRALSCGGTVWIPSGDQIGYRTRIGVTGDGRNSVVVSMSTQLQDSADSALAQEAAATELIDNALCAARD